MFALFPHCPITVLNGKALFFFFFFFSSENFLQLSILIQSHECFPCFICLLRGISLQVLFGENNFYIYFLRVQHYTLEYEHLQLVVPTSSNTKTPIFLIYIRPLHTPHKTQTLPKYPGIFIPPPEVRIPLIFIVIYLFRLSITIFFCVVT